MATCTVDRCDELISKKGHTLCYAHWQAEKSGDLTECQSCGALKEGARTLCNACLRKEKESPRAKGVVSTLRVAGQGAREKSEELAKKSPMRTLLSKLTFDIIPTDENAWRLGAMSEEAVGRELDNLPKGWGVRHDITIRRGGGNADHVVVGPPGVFVLDTKFRSGEVRTMSSGIRVNGRKTRMAEAVQEQARVIYGMLKEALGGGLNWVQPVLVFDNEFRGRRDPDGVHVVGSGELVEYLTEMPRDLSVAEVKQVTAALLDDKTWAL